MSEGRSANSHAYDLLVQAIVDYAIYMIDPQGRITNWNSGAQRIKGYEADEIVGRFFGEFYTPEDQAAGMPQRSLRIATENGRYEAEGWRVRKDGTRFWASVVIDAIRSPDGELLGFAKITRDITERRETQRRLEEAREQLFQSQKIDALGQLTGGLAHDFNNLLTAIISGVELSLRNLDNPDRLRSLLEGIRGSAQRGGSLTKQLLAFARRQPLKPARIDLPEQMTETIGLLRHSLRSDIELILEVSDQLWPVEVDPGQLELAILNLGFNARDAMSDGGELRVTVRNVTLNGEVEGLTGDFVAVGVTDTGAGIPDEIRDRIFEPFFTTKGFGQGTGLGLSQVYGFARQSLGALTVDSQVGVGSTLTLYLPAARAHNGMAAEGRAAAHVLVVEDDPVVAELAAALLADMGYGATVVYSPTEALNALITTPVDAVFSDVIMPGSITGVELAQRIRERRPELPILLTTGYSETASRNSAEFPVLPKPYAFEELKAAMRQLLGPSAASVSA